MVNQAGLLAVFGRQEDAFGVERSYDFHVATYRLLDTQSTLASERALAQAWGSYVRQGPSTGALGDLVEARLISPAVFRGLTYYQMDCAACSFFDIPALQDAFCERGFSTYIKQRPFTRVFSEAITAYVGWLSAYNSRIDFFEQKQLLQKNL